ncbi:hypothetical protein FRB91_009259 [Serendipita sp. 411]|nr:hypothetical protein FRB91_009259 [Serendipita sp. 411]
MYSTFQRLNNISTFITTCTLALLVGISLSTFLLSTTPTGKLSVAPVKIAMRQTSPWSARREEAAFFEFNIDADLRPLFHWNTKQVFVYLSAEYTNGKGVSNHRRAWPRRATFYFSNLLSLLRLLAIPLPFHQSIFVFITSSSPIHVLSLSYS